MFPRTVIGAALAIASIGFSLPSANHSVLSQDQVLLRRVWGWTTKAEAAGYARLSSEEPPSDIGPSSSLENGGTWPQVLRKWRQTLPEDAVVESVRFVSSARAGEKPREALEDLDSAFLTHSEHGSAPSYSIRIARDERLDYLLSPHGPERTLDGNSLTNKILERLPEAAKIYKQEVQSKFEDKWRTECFLYKGRDPLLVWLNCGQIVKEMGLKIIELFRKEQAEFTPIGWRFRTAPYSTGGLHLKELQAFIMYHRQTNQLEVIFRDDFGFDTKTWSDVLPDASRPRRPRLGKIGA